MATSATRYKLSNYQKYCAQGYQVGCDLARELAPDAEQEKALRLGNQEIPGQIVGGLLSVALFTAAAAVAAGPGPGPLQHAPPPLPRRPPMPSLH